jgi:hypothetical protein
MVRRKRCHGCGRFPKKGARIPTSVDSFEIPNETGYNGSFSDSLNKERGAGLSGLRGQPSENPLIDETRRKINQLEAEIYRIRQETTPSTSAKENQSIVRRIEAAMQQIEHLRTIEQEAVRGNYMRHPANDRRGGSVDARDTPEFWAECEKQYGKAQTAKMKRMYNKMKAPKRERGPSVEAPLTPKPKTGKGTRKKRGRGVDDFNSEFDRVDPVDKALWRKQKKPKVNTGHYAMKMHQ